MEIKHQNLGGKDSLEYLNNKYENISINFNLMLEETEIKLEQNQNEGSSDLTSSFEELQQSQGILEGFEHMINYDWFNF